MSVKQRLIEFIKYKNIGQKKFAQTVGVSDGYVNAIRVSIQPNTLHKIVMHYPELNTGWLLTGEGEMLKQPSQPHSRNIANTHGANSKIIQGGDVVIGRNVGDIGGIEDIRENRHKRTSHENNEDYNRRISEIGEKYNTLLLSKNELLQEKDERIKELKNQIEQLNKMIKLLCEK